MLWGARGPVEYIHTHICIYITFLFLYICSRAVEERHSGGERRVGLEMKEGGVGVVRNGAGRVAGAWDGAWQQQQQQQHDNSNSDSNMTTAT